jgi:hypothetical protein
MVNLYPKSGATLKKCVRVLTVIGYFVSDLFGVFVGLVTWWLLRLYNVDYVVCVLATMGAALLGATPLVLLVWFNGLVHWTISDAAEDTKALREQQGV